MRVLLVGGGGREHTLAWKLAQSPRLTELIAAPGNPGIARLGRCVAIKDHEIEGLRDLALRERVDLTVVGPELPLSLGLVDRFRERGLAVFGPSQAAARLESSKAFAKNLMARYRIPTARYRVFDELAPARAWCRELGVPLVVKADGLAAGKGVLICRTLADADAALALCLESGAFGAAGASVVVEEFMEGEEASFFAITDGTAILPLAGAQDHKTVFDGDHGPNTGGMGAYSPAPILDAPMADRVMVEIVRPTVAAMAREGVPFAGFLYVGLMIGRDGPRVVEFNCRFGDPECQVVMPRLGDDLLPLLAAVAGGGGLPAALAWKPDAAVCVVLASGGYPGRYGTGLPITGIEEAEALPGVQVFHAGTARRDGVLVTAGGRVLGVHATGPDLRAAVDTAYAAADRIQFTGKHHRRDIAWRALHR
jgi:phosphoribosylamine--glycine ligase